MHLYVQQTIITYTISIFCQKAMYSRFMEQWYIFCCISFTIIQYHGLIQFSITFCISIKLLYQNHRLRIGTFGIPTIPVLIIYYIKELNGVVLNVERTKMENGQEQPKTDMTTTQQNEVIFYNQCKQWKKKIFDQSTIKQNLSILFNMHRSRYNLFFQLKMKTSKGHTLIKCMVLFSIILVAIVLSAVVTGYWLR